MIRLVSPLRQVAQTQSFQPDPRICVDKLFLSDNKAPKSCAPVAEDNQESCQTEAKQSDCRKQQASCADNSNPVKSCLASHHRPTERSIKFGEVRIHKHNLTLGDNPSVTSGLPLSLDWDHDETERFDVDDYEQIKESHPTKLTKISEEDREALLKEQGHSNQTLALVSQDIEAIKEARKKTLAALVREAQMREYKVLSNVSLRDFRRQHPRRPVKTNSLDVPKEAPTAKGIASQSPTRRTSLLGLLGFPRDDRDQSTDIAEEDVQATSLPKEQGRRRWSLLNKWRNGQGADLCKVDVKDATPNCCFGSSVIDQSARVAANVCVPITAPELGSVEKEIASTTTPESTLVNQPTDRKAQREWLLREISKVDKEIKLLKSQLEPQATVEAEKHDVIPHAPAALETARMSTEIVHTAPLQESTQQPVSPYKERSTRRWSLFGSRNGREACNQSMVEMEAIDSNRCSEKHAQSVQSPSLRTRTGVHGAAHKINRNYYGQLRQGRAAQLPFRD